MEKWVRKVIAIVFYLHSMQTQFLRELVRATWPFRWNSRLGLHFAATIVRKLVMLLQFVAAGESVVTVVGIMRKVSVLKEQHCGSC